MNNVVSTGDLELDNFLYGGYRKKELNFVCSRPGIGRTRWLLKTAFNSAKSGSNVLFASMETNLEQCLQIVKPKEPLENFYLLNDFNLNVSKIRNNLLELKNEINFDLLYIDFLQIFYTRKNSEPISTEDYDEICNDLEILAEEFNLSIVIGCQLNRRIEERNDKRPIISDIKNSYFSDRYASSIFSLYRDAYYNKENEIDMIEIDILKSKFKHTNTRIVKSFSSFLN